MMLSGAALALLLAGPAFDLGATQRALARPEGREAALTTLDRLSPPDRATARAAGIGGLLVAIAADPAASLRDRAWSLRLAPLYDGPPEPLAPLLAGADTPEAVALAREAAQALSVAGATALLAAGRAHPDPEVRATVARSGALGADTCALLSDPWPAVRRAAAQGLRRHPAAAGCLVPALSDADPSVVMAATRVAGGSGVAALQPALRRIAGNARAAIPARVEAIIALGHLGDTEPARRILSTHAAKGGIEPLADAAVRALAGDASDASLQPLRDALRAPSERVRVSAAQALAQRGDRDSLPAIRALAARCQPQARAALAAALQRLDPQAATLGEAVGSDAPEDASED